MNLVGNLIDVAHNSSFDVSDHDLAHNSSFDVSDIELAHNSSLDLEASQAGSECPPSGS